MNFCQINVSEYFVIADDAQHDKNKKRKKKENKQNLIPARAMERDSIKYSPGSVYLEISARCISACAYNTPLACPRVRAFNKFFLALMQQFRNV